MLPCIESYKKVDLRTITLGVPPQELLTKDSVTVSVDAVVYYRVSNAIVSVTNVKDTHHSTKYDGRIINKSEYKYLNKGMRQPSRVATDTIASTRVLIISDTSCPYYNVKLS